VERVYCERRSIGTGPVVDKGSVMSFADAVRSCLSQYATFSGRARRSEFWWFGLFELVVVVVASLLDQIFGGTGFLALIVLLALIVPSLAVTWRRLHDTGRSGGWYFITFVPLVGSLVLLVFCLMDSVPGQNAYGPSPKVGYGQPLPA
jgi:uncharacterized membrane protein YhaH (DUF805 family)